MLLKMCQGLFIFLFLFAFSYTAKAEQVSLNQFLTTYLENSSALKQGWQDLEKSKGGVQKSKAIDDLRLKLSGGYNYKKDLSMGFSKYDSAGILAIEGGLDKVFSASGTRVSLSHTFNRISTKDGVVFIPPAPSFNSPDYTGYNPGLTLAVVQPLMKNFLGFQDKFPFELAKIAEKIQKIQFSQSLEQEIIEGISAYLDWVFLVQQRKILKDIINTNLGVLRDTEAQVKAGMAENSDLEVAKEAVITFENNLLEIDNAYFALMLKMKKLVPFLTENSLPNENILLEGRSLEEKDLEKTKSLQILNLMKGQLKLLLGVKEDSLLPDLNLILSYKMLGSKDSVGSAYGDLKTSELFFGFEFSLPLFNSQAKGEVKESKADYLKFVEQYDSSKKDLFNAEKTLKNSFTTYQNLIEAQKKYIQSIERKIKDEEKQYRQGMLSLRELSRTSTELANARLTLTRYITAYHAYYYQYLGLVNGVFDKHLKEVPQQFKELAY